MLFASKVSGLRIDIRNAKVQKAADENGNLQTLELRPHLTADFHARALTETQRIIAKAMFVKLNPDYPFGCVPYAVGDAMGSEFSTEDVMSGTRYVGYDPAWNIGKFDTRTDIDYDAQGCESDEDRAALKKLVEDHLLSRPELNQEYVRLDESLPRPWPNYPVENGPGVAQKIIAAAREFGIPLETIIEFEMTQDEPKKGTISMAEAEIAKEHAAKAEDAALGAVIPS